MENQPQDPELRINPENFHTWLCQLVCSADNICKQFLVYPDQDQQNIGPDLDLNCLTLMECLIILSKKAILKNTQLKTKSKEKS